MIVFGLVGEYQKGKSTLINCLLQREIATLGTGEATTHAAVFYSYGEREYIKYQTTDGQVKSFSPVKLAGLDTVENIEVIYVYLNNTFLKSFSLVDLPGFGNNQRDNALQEKYLSKLDYALVVTSNHKADGGEYSVLRRSVEKLAKYDIPYYLILNTVDSTNRKWLPQNKVNLQIAKENSVKLRFYPHINFPFLSDELLVVNLMWYWYSIDENESALSEIKPMTDLNVYKMIVGGKLDKEKIKKFSNFQLILRIFDNEVSKSYLKIKKNIRELLLRVRRDLFPIGCIQLFAFNEVPDGWLPCDGSELEISVYKELYDKIGNRYGEVENGGFRIPDLRNQFVRGWNPEGNRSLGDIQESALQSHGHKTKFGNAGMAGNHSHSSRYRLTSAVSSALMHLKRERKVVGSINTNSRCVTPTVISHRHIISETTAIEIVGQKRNTPRTDVEIRPKNISMLYCIRVI